MSRDSKIIIVGGGPTGLTAGILLRQRGLNPIVLERRHDQIGYPAAHVVNTRTMEIMAELGVGERMWAEGDNTAMSGKIVWVESMAGREYGVLSVRGAAEDDRGPLSRYRSLNLPQTHLERILAERFMELGGDLRYGHCVSDLRQDETEGEVTVDTADGQQVMKFDWLIGCDGAGSMVRRSVGIDMDGPPSLARFMTIYFHADFDRYREGRKAVLYWIGGTDARGVFLNFDKHGRSWAMLVPIGDARVEDFSNEDATRILNKAMGDFDIEVKIDSISTWNMSAQVAQSYRAGHVLLAGDACHRFPPMGGLGMNTGIQDAHNLAWKLDAVVSGLAPSALLDSYQVERRAIAQRNTDQSVKNMMKMGQIDEALGVPLLAPVSLDDIRGPVRQHDAAVVGIDGDGAMAQRRRAAVQAAIENQAEHFDQGAGMDLGFIYDEGLVAHDGCAPGPSDISRYRPDAHPGARLPFSSPDGSFAASTLGRVAPVGITLFALDPAWHEAAQSAVAATGVPVTVLTIGADANFGPNASDLLGIEKSGAVTVRPDGHVLWRDASVLNLDGFQQALGLLKGE
ncbi:FAD-dependent monooxygenase [Chachezhania sediminis]|uniref:FAD-dependent monooxygenase n=1 Tax=Chachezhania sediminis TaxID=2599291 RepID=UPI00131C8299|nr:FAD-dependent monooxygenase [Chachezhania sediminis]